MQAFFQSVAREQPQQHLGVGVSAKSLSRPFQLFAQFPEVVDLAVEHDHVTAIGTDHGLVAQRRQIDDGQAHEPELHRPLSPDAVIVRAAMVEAGDTAREVDARARGDDRTYDLSLIHISEPTRLGMISYAV